MPSDRYFLIAARFGFFLELSHLARPFAGQSLIAHQLRSWVNPIMTVEASVTGPLIGPELDTASSALLTIDRVLCCSNHGLHVLFGDAGLWSTVLEVE